MTDNKQIDAIEMHPVMLEGEEEGCKYWTQCEPEEAEMWAVYVHYPGEGLECVADFDTEAAALQLKRMLEITGKMFVQS